MMLNHSKTITATKAKKVGSSHMGHCPSHDDKTPSLKIDLKNGQTLIHCKAGCPQDKVLAALPTECFDDDQILQQPRLSIVPKKPPADDGYRELRVVPSDAGEPIQALYELGKPDRRYEYRDQNGGLICYVYRWDKTNGEKLEKEFRPRTCWRDRQGKIRWRWKNFNEWRPIYGQDRLAERPDRPVVIVEGEKAADAAQELLPGYVCISYMQGSGAADKVDCTPLRGRDVYLWPDNDKAGREAAVKLIKKLLSLGVEVWIIKLPKTTPEKWDAANALADGWTPERALELVESAVKPDPQLIAEEPAQEEKRARKRLPPDSAVAELLLAELKNKVVWDRASQDWHLYNGGYWERRPEEEVHALLLQALKAKFPTQDGFSARKVKSVAECFSWLNTLSGWCEDRNRIPMANGVLVLGDDGTPDRLEPHHPDHYFNWSLPYKYDPAATCPQTMAWLEQTMRGSQGMVMILQAWLAAVVTGRADLQKYLEMIGAGGTGKGTYMNLARLLAGERNCHTTELKRLETNRFETAAIYGKRLVTITDSKRFAGDVDMLKALTGGDAIPFEEKLKNPQLPFIPAAMVMVAANEPITSTDYTSGLQRRRLTVHFNHKVKDPDPVLLKKLKAELPGILNWVLALTREDVTDIILNAHRVPEVQDQRFDYLLETNPLAEWLNERCVYDSEAKTYVGRETIDQFTKELADVHTKLYPNYLAFLGWPRARNPISFRRFSYLLHDLCANQLRLDVAGGAQQGCRDMYGAFFRGLALRKLSDETTPQPVYGTRFLHSHDISPP